MHVSRSGYYTWRKGVKSPRQEENEMLIPIVRAAHKKSKGTYGARRMAIEIEAFGFSCGRFKAGTVMKLAGVAAKQKKKFKATTDSKHNLPVAPNLLKREFTVKAPDQVYVSDITYIWTTEGWLYLAVILDLFSRQIVGWSLNSRMTSQLIQDALQMAIWRRRPAPGLIFHSDRGSQYFSKDFQKMLKAHKMKSSMSRKGDCWDNGVPRTPQGDALREMRVRPLGIGLQDRVPNHVELLGSRALGSEHQRKGVIKDVRCDAGRRTQVNH